MRIREGIVLLIGSLLLAGCFHTPGAWQGIRPAQPTPSVVTTATPTQTLEQVESEISDDLQTGLDEDFKAIDEDLKAVDKDLGSY